MTYAQSAKTLGLPLDRPAPKLGWSIPCSENDYRRCLGATLGS